MGWFEQTFGKNWKTTIGGILLGVPPIILTSAVSADIHLAKVVIMVLGISTGLGGLLLGLTAKDSTTNTTLAQAQAEQAKVEGHTEASEMIKVANAQAAGREPNP